MTELDNEFLEESGSFSANPLRPVSFDDYIGQPQIVERLKLYIAATNRKRERGEDCVMDHMIVDGRAGLGKTSLAVVVANTLGSNFVFLQATAIEHKREILSNLMLLKEGDVLFVDEIHGLKKDVAEALYSAVEDSRVDIVTEERTINLPLPKFTLIAATTDYGKLTPSLRQRFTYRFTLQRYSEEELKTIVEYSANKLGYNVTDEAAIALASRAKGIPRLVNHNVKKACLVAEFNEGVIDRKVAEQMLAMEEIGELGLDVNDFAYLKALESSKPLGIKTLSSKSNIDEATIVDSIEPYLLEFSLIEKTARGRILTERGEALLYNTNRL